MRSYGDSTTTNGAAACDPDGPPQNSTANSRPTASNEWSPGGVSDGIVTSTEKLPTSSTPAKPIDGAAGSSTWRLTPQSPAKPLPATATIAPACTSAGSTVSDGPACACAAIPGSKATARATAARYARWDLRRAVMPPDPFTPYDAAPCSVGIPDSTRDSMKPRGPRGIPGPPPIPPLRGVTARAARNLR